jgi:hypothetical protein
MRIRFRLKTLLGLVLGIALVLGFYVTFVQNPPWNRVGGMIGWSQAAIESRLGAPSQVFEYDLPDPHAQNIRPRTPGTYRTLVFSRFDGRFIVWLKEGDQGYVCYGSSWSEKGTYY